MDGQSAFPRRSPSAPLMVARWFRVGLEGVRRRDCRARDGQRDICRWIAALLARGRRPNGLAIGNRRAEWSATRSSDGGGIVRHWRSAGRSMRRWGRSPTSSSSAQRSEHGHARGGARTVGMTVCGWWPDRQPSPAAGPSLRWWGRWRGQSRSICRGLRHHPPADAAVHDLRDCCLTSITLCSVRNLRSCWSATSSVADSFINWEAKN